MSISDNFCLSFLHNTHANAWMDERVWSGYLHRVFAPKVERPSVVVLDNLDNHMSTESEEIVSTGIFSVLRAIPPTRQRFSAS